MFENLPELVNADPAIVRWGRGMNETFMVEVGDDQYLCTVSDGKLAVATGPFVMRSWSFAIRAKAQCWEKFWQNPPAPGWHDLFALLRRGVEPDHLRLIDGPLQPVQRCNRRRRKLPPVQEHGLVLWEEPPIVLQGAQAVLSDLGIRGVGVLNVD